MRFCISGRQPISILKQADEIKLQYSDIDKLIDYAKDFFDKTFIIEIPYDVLEDEINWNLFSAYAEEITFYFALNKLTQHMIEHCKEYGIKYYYNQPIFTWNELTHILPLGVDYVVLTDKLYFNLEKVKAYIGNVKIRLCPNIAYDEYIPRNDGIYGQWIRPEDTELYGQWVDVFEFNEKDLNKEATYLDIYKNKQSWPGNLNLLIKNFGINVDNRVIPEELGKMRANCGLRCMENHSCHLCENAIKFSNQIRKKHLQSKA